MQANEDSKRDRLSVGASGASSSAALANAGAASAGAAQLPSRVTTPAEPRGTAEPPASRFHAQVGVSAAHAAGATVLLDLRNGMYHTLNESAGSLWAVIEAGDATLATLVDVLCAGHPDVSRDTITRDVKHLLETFLEAGLITADRVRSDAGDHREGGGA